MDGAASELRHEIATLARALPDDRLVGALDAERLTDLVKASLAQPHRTTQAPTDEPGPDVEELRPAAEAPALRHRSTWGACSVCSSPERSEIEAGLAAGDSCRVIGARFGFCRQTINRHRTRCTTIPALTRGGRWPGQEAPIVAPKRKAGRRRGPHLTREDIPLEGEPGETLPYPRLASDGVTPLGIDLAAPGQQKATIAEDVRCMVIARLKGRAAALDPDDVVSDVYRRIIMRNMQRCAFDPRLASVSKYTYTLATCAIADALKAEARHPVGVEEDEALEAVAAEADPDAAPFDPELLPLDLEEREAFFLKACSLELFGPPEATPLWRRALEQRQTEQAIERGEPVPEAPRAPLAEAIMGHLREAGRPVARVELAAAMGKSPSSIAVAMKPLEASGDVEARSIENPGRGKRSVLAYVARPAPADALPASVPTPLPSQPADEQAEALPEVAAEEPAISVVMIASQIPDEDEAPDTERGMAWTFEPEPAPVPRARRTLRGLGLVDPERIAAALAR